MRARIRGSRSLLSALVFVILCADPTPAGADEYFLHTAVADTLDQTSPVETTATFKDSPAVTRTTFQPIGTWAVAPAGGEMRLETLTALHTWVGLKNSDDQGTYFDVPAEIRKNGVVIASGETRDIY